MPAAREVEPVPATAPAIASSVVSGVRRLLIEDGRWIDVRERMIARDPRASEWIDGTIVGPWIALERHLAIMSALQDVVGDDGLRAIGKNRLRDSVSAGVLAPIFRSWARSYAAAPAQLIRVTPHVWSAATRNLGSLRVDSVGEREMTLRVVPTPEPVRRNDAWQRFLEGYGLGVLELGSLEGEVAIAPERESITISARW